MVSLSIEAAQFLAGEGLSVRVAEMHTVKPLDDALVERCARETGAIVTAEEHSVIGGLGGAVAECLVRTRPVPVERVGIADTFTESGPYLELLDKYGLSVNGIVGAVHEGTEAELSNHTNGSPRPNLEPFLEPFIAESRQRRRSTRMRAIVRDHGALFT